MNAPNNTPDQFEESTVVDVVPGIEHYRTYWLTRNRTNGQLEGKVDVWLTRPERLAFKDGDVQWLVLDRDTVEEVDQLHFGRWTVADALQRVGNGVPHTDRECTRVGTEPGEELQN